MSEKEQKLDEHGYPYVEYPGGIRLKQELGRMEGYLEHFGKSREELPYEITKGLYISTDVLSTALRIMLETEDPDELRRHANVAMKVTQFLGSLVVCTDDFLTVALDERKRLAHSVFMACGCLDPEEELPF